MNSTRTHGLLTEANLDTGRYFGQRLLVNYRVVFGN